MNRNDVTTEVPMHYTVTGLPTTSGGWVGTFPGGGTTDRILSGTATDDTDVALTTGITITVDD